jgi:hypothetical protein
MQLDLLYESPNFVCMEREEFLYYLEKGRTYDQARRRNKAARSYNRKKNARRDKKAFREDCQEA